MTVSTLHKQNIHKSTLKSYIINMFEICFYFQFLFCSPRKLCVYIHLKTSSESVRIPYCWILTKMNCSGFWHCKHIDNFVYRTDKHETMWMQTTNKQSGNLVSVSFLRHWWQIIFRWKPDMTVVECMSVTNVKMWTMISNRFSMVRSSCLATGQGHA